MVKVTKEGLSKIALEIINTIMRKNADYGDAWQRYGIFTPLIRINDKILRVQTLSDGRKALVADEAIEDTLEDIVAYGLLALLKINAEKVTAPTQLGLYTHMEEILRSMPDGDTE